MSEPGHPSICGGDFNSLWDLEENGGGGYRAPLSDWATGMGWKSRRDDFSRSEKCITRPSTHLTGGSEIDHVLFNSPTMRLNSYSAGTDGLWLGISDHRPVLIGFSHLPHPHLQDTPRFNKHFGNLKRLQIIGFAPSAPQLKKFHQQLEFSWCQLPHRPESGASAEQQLDHLTQITRPGKKEVEKARSLQKALETDLRGLTGSTSCHDQSAATLWRSHSPSQASQVVFSLDRTLGISRVMGE